MVHPVDEREVLVDVAGPAPVVDRIVDQVLIREADDGGLVGRELAVDELDLGLLEKLVDVVDRGQRDVDLLQHCLHHRLLALDG